MRLIALDIGERRIGLAVSDSGILASPHSVLQRKSKAEDFARLGRLITELKIERVIVGLPYSLSDPTEIGPQARRVQRYAEALAATLSIPIEYFDERYSTVDAAAYLAIRGQKKIAIDAAAAAVILQNYLDSLKNQSGHPMDTEHG
ncbi:MAG: Holliday junction resolvase RuvX [Anaerolineales bacterium]|nr:Holliday junction resolvase RuvX [Anaerolineales bacterium]